MPIAYRLDPRIHFFVLVGLIALHVAAAVIVEIREGGAVISAKFTGRKFLDRPPEDAD